MTRAPTNEIDPQPRERTEPARGRVAPEELLRIKRTVSIVELVRSYGVTLAGSGDNLRGNCCLPGHDDTTPSLIVSPEKGLFHCMGKCNVGGDVIAWVMRMERCSFVRAVEILRVRAPLRELSRRSRRPEAPPTPLAATDEPDADVLRRVVLEEYPNILRQDRTAQHYLEKRGLADVEMLEHFKVGHSNRTLGFKLSTPMREQLARVGLLRESGHEHFVGTVTVPVLSESGEVLEVYGRRLQVSSNKVVKHLYLPARADGRRGVFNVAGLRGASEVFLCEALLDAMTMWSAGYRAVTSSYGVSGFTKELRDALLEHEVKRVFIAYDGDEAGDRGAAEVARELESEGIATYRLKFPDGSDANAYGLMMKSEPSRGFATLIASAAQLGGPRAVVVPEAIAPEPAVVLAPAEPTAVTPEPTQVTAPEPTFPLAAVPIAPSSHASTPETSSPDELKVPYGANIRSAFERSFVHGTASR